LNLGPLNGDEWGFTGTFAKENGGGFLTDHYPRVRMFEDDMKATFRLLVCPHNCLYFASHLGYEGVLGY
jgi:hypothetical protein